MWHEFSQRFDRLLSGEAAVAQAGEQNRIERFFTFPNFERSADRCGEVMQHAGLADVKVESFPADGQTAWSGWDAMKAWDVESARLWLVSPHRELLADWSVKPQHLVMYSGPTDTEAEVVEWNGEPKANLNGKIPLTRHRLTDVFAQMRARKIPGILSDFIGVLPGIRDRFDLPDDVRWENSAIRNGHGAFWGFQITPRDGDRIRELLRRGPVRVRAEIRSRVYNGIFKSATGVIPGSGKTDEEILFVTHLYEPGGNDNASGVGLGLELARSLNEGVRKGVLPRPKRAIRFMFNWEGFGLYAWTHRHRDRIPHILGGLNIDEVGVDQSKGRSVLHLFMPPAANPSFIGHLVEHLCGEILTPSLRWKAVADRAEIINDTITSDPNMDIVLPCLIQYPAKCYHTSADTMDMLSAEVMKAIGMVCGTHLYLLANAGPREIRFFSSLVLAKSRQLLDRTALRLLAGSWPFDRERTGRWLAEQFALSVKSLERFGCDSRATGALRQELLVEIQRWLEKWKTHFPVPTKRSARTKDLKRASTLVLKRLTLGSPSCWSKCKLTGREEQAYREVLYPNNLDLLFHRLCYWVDGKRTLLEIVERLEFELDELLRDTSIARTSSGSMIEKTASRELNLEAVLFIADHLIRSGYLRPA